MEGWVGECFCFRRKRDASSGDKGRCHRLEREGREGGRKGEKKKVKSRRGGREGGWEGEGGEVIIQKH